MIMFPGIVAQLTSTLIISYISHEYNDVVPDVLLCTNGVIMVRYRFSLIADNPLINTNSIKTNEQTNNNNKTTIQCNNAQNVY